MKPTRWELIKELFHSTLEREPRQRSAFLEEACDGDASLRREVELLLEAHQNVATTIAGTTSFPSEVEWEDTLAGRKIGSYQVLHRIGQGGMATVYLAVRADDQYKKRVAIKLIPPRPDNRELVRRFRNERQTLAALDHPNIVKLLDGGTSEDGFSYLVMDYVEGTGLNAYCDHHKLSIDERLQLFRTVCEAVQYAHQRLIIHRDLKPDNILVTADGTVKLLDFGIAKLLNPEAAATLVVTRAGQRAMTPRYASPEQVRGEPLTNASDIYSLGVVLYELLTGHRLYQLKSHNIGEIEHAICEKEPVKPSTVVTQPEQETLPDGTTKTTTAEEISRVRVAAPKKLRSRLHGDLDAIIMMALRKEPQRRYASVYDFSEDIRRHLEGLPVNARPSTLTYRTVKFLRRHKEAAATALAIFFLVAAATSWFLYSHRAHTLTEKDTIVLADFTNRTGDPVFDDALRTALTVSLRQSPFLNVLSDSKVVATLRRMTRPADTPLTSEVARELCQRAGGTAYIAGSIASLGSQYVLGLRAVNCLNGETLAQEEVTAEGKEKVLDALGRAASKLRGELGESLATVQRFDVPLPEATTPSFEALKSYSLAQQALNEKDDIAAAIPLHKRAIDLDPNFADAYLGLATCYWNAGDVELAAQNAKKAYDLRIRVSERERLSIETHYEIQVTGNLEAAERTLETQAQVYPRDVSAFGNLGVVHSQMGQYDKAVADDLKALALDPARTINYANLVSAYRMVNRFDDARSVIERCRRQNLDSTTIHWHEYALAFLQGDAGVMARQAAWAKGKTGFEDSFLSLEANTEAYWGRLAKARELTARTVALAELAQDKEGAAEHEVLGALQEALFRNSTRARKEAASALALSRGRDIQPMAATALAIAGDTAQADSLAADLEKRYPEDTLQHRKYIPTIRAAAEVSRENPSKAIEILQPALPVEFGETGSFSLYPVYVRGQAYLEERQGNEAVAEFQKILDHSGIVLNEPIAALSHLGLARAYGLQGDTAKARAAYKDFLTLWKDADPDIPILKQAKAEYAKLQ